MQLLAELHKQGATIVMVCRSISTSATDPSESHTGPSGKRSPLVITRGSAMTFPRVWFPPSLA